MQLRFSEHDLIIQYINKQVGITPVLVDVGAHVGTVTGRFAEKNWRVIAFEPEPTNHQQLLDQVGSNSQVTVIQKAVSDEAGSADFYVSPIHYGIHSLKPFHESHSQKITVQMTRLDTALKELQINAVGYLKIDVEGADFLALRSFDFETIQPQLVMVEFMNERSVPNFGYTYHDMVHYLAQFGYKTWVSEWGEIQSYGVKGETGRKHTFIRCEPYPIDNEPVWGNLIFVPEKDSPLFQTELDNYLAREIRYAKGRARQQWIEQLPAGKQIYRLARKIRKQISN